MQIIGFHFWAFYMVYIKITEYLMPATYFAQELYVLYVLHINIEKVWCFTIYSALVCSSPKCLFAFHIRMVLTIMGTCMINLINFQYAACVFLFCFLTIFFSKWHFCCGIMFQIREFEYSPEDQEGRKQELEKLMQDQDALRTSLLQWCYASYGEVHSLLIISSVNNTSQLHTHNYILIYACKFWQSRIQGGRKQFVMNIVYYHS